LCLQEGQESRPAGISRSGRRPTQAYFRSEHLAARGAAYTSAAAAIAVRIVAESVEYPAR